MHLVHIRVAIAESTYSLSAQPSNKEARVLIAVIRKQMVISDVMVDDCGNDLSGDRLSSGQRVLPGEDVSAAPDGSE